MTLPIVLQPEAQEELDGATVWYEHRRPGLGFRFFGEVQATLERIADSPTIYAVLKRRVRSAPVHSFPFRIFYRVLDDRIDVISVFHGSRNPREWQRRT